MNHSQPNASRNASSGICRKNDDSGIWLAWAAHGGALLIDELAHVDGGGDLRLRRAHLVEVGRVGSVVAGGEVGRAGRHEALDVIAVERLLVDPRRPGELTGAHADAVHLHVVGVSVAAVVVVHGEHVGLLLGEDRGEPARSFLDVGRPERTLGVVRRLAFHARVDVSEELDARDSEHLGGAVRLDHPAFGEALAGREEPVVDLAYFTPGGHDEDDPVPFGCRARHDPAGCNSFIVGVGVEGDQGERHHTILSRATVFGACRGATSNLTLVLGNCPAALRRLGSNGG